MQDPRRDLQCAVDLDLRQYTWSLSWYCVLSLGLGFDLATRVSQVLQLPISLLLCIFILIDLIYILEK